MRQATLISCGAGWYKVVCKSGDSRLYVRYKRNGAFHLCSSTFDAQTFRKSTARRYRSELERFGWYALVEEGA